MPTTPSGSEALQDFCTFFKSFTRFDSHQNSRVLFQSYPEKPNKNLPTLTYFHTLKTKLPAAFEALQEKNYLGYSGNFCFNEVVGRKIKENVKRVRCFVVDIDSGIRAEVLEKLIELLKPSYVVVSSRSGTQPNYTYKAHFYWSINFTEPETTEELTTDWPDLQQALAFKVEDILVQNFNLTIQNPITGLTDKGIINPAGTLRVPGLIHAKDPEHPYLSRTVHTDESIVIDETNFKEFFNELGIDSFFLKSVKAALEDIKELKKQQGRETRGTNGAAATKPSRPLENKKISRYNGAAEGDRHRSIIDYCRNLFFGRCFTLNEAAGATKEENLRSNNPPLEEVELEGIIEWCWTEYLKGLTASKRERVERGDSFAVKDLIREAMWEARPVEVKEPTDHIPFNYDYSEIINFPSFISDTALAEKLMQRMGLMPKERKNCCIGINEASELCSYVGSGIERCGLWSFDDGYVYEKMKDVFFDTVTDREVEKLFTDNKGRVNEKEWNNFKRYLYSSKQQNAVAAVLKKSTKLRIKESEFNKNPNLIHVKNGTLDIETGVLKPWNAKDYITMTTGVRWRECAEDLAAYKVLENEWDYNDGDYANLWTRFIYEVMDGNLEMCRYLHKIFGYSLLGKNPEELIFFLYGDGQNGKSVYIETLLNLLGDYAFTVPVGIFTENGKENKAALVAQLVGKRVISTSEVKSSHTWDEESLKSMSGMDKVNARALFSKSFSFIPAFKTFVRGNHCPNIPSDDEGTWRRIRLVPFNVLIPTERRDTKLIEKLSTPESLQELLVWAVAGYQIYMEEGLKPPREAQAATLLYRQEMNPISTFMKECFDKVGDGKSVECFKNGTHIDDIERIYIEWNTVNAGERLSKIQLSKQLHKDKFMSKVVKDDEGRSIKKYAVKVNEKGLNIKGQVGKKGTKEKVIKGNFGWKGSKEEQEEA